MSLTMHPYLRFQFDESIITFRRSYLQLQHNGRMIRRKRIVVVEKPAEKQITEFWYCVGASSLITSFILMECDQLLRL